MATRTARKSSTDTSTEVTPIRADVKIPAARKSATVKPTDTKTTTTDVTTTDVMYYAGMSADAIKSDLTRSAKLLNGSAMAFARKMAEAFHRDAHGQLNVTWDVFVKQVTEDATWDKALWGPMVSILKDAGLENKEIAAAVKVSDRTVKRLNVAAGRVNVNRVNGQVASVEAKRTDPTTRATTTTTAKVAGQTIKEADTTEPRTPRGVVGNTNVASVVKAANETELVKALAARPDVAKIMSDLFAASQSK